MRVSNNFTPLVLLIIFIGNFSIFSAHCDQSRRQDSDKSRATSAISRISLRRGGQVNDNELDKVLHHPHKHNILKKDNPINRVQEDGIFDIDDDTIQKFQRTLVKRSAQGSSRRKPPKVHLAQRPKPSSTTTTTSTSTTTTTTTSKPSANDESNNEEAEYEEAEEEENSSSTEADIRTTTMRASKATSTETEAEAETEADEEEEASKRTRQKNRKESNQTRSELRIVKNENSRQSTIITGVQKKKPLVALPFIKPKNSSICLAEAYLEFPRDLIGDKWRGRGLILIHIAVVCYMFYSLALVCERYFMPSLEEFAQRLQLSEDVAGATLMSAGSSAPELFIAILGVFIAKGDIGTGTIVGSAVFNILFVIGVCAFVSTSSAQLNWWPVVRDSVFYCFTVLVLILFIYDERVTALESFTMLALYGLYIMIMAHNEPIKEYVTKNLLAYPCTASLISSIIISADGQDDVFGSSSGSGSNLQSATDKKGFFSGLKSAKNYQTTSMTVNKDLSKTVEEDSMFLAACLIIVQHKRLFRSNLRFQSAARYIIIKRQHRIEQQQEAARLKSQSNHEVNYFGPESEPLKSSQHDRMEAYARGGIMSKNKFSIVSKDDYEFWNRPPEEGENYYLWMAKIPVNYVLHYTIPDCALYPDKYIFTFFISILWTAFFSYIMVWMVTLIGYTLGIPDSVMGTTFLAAGTSVPDCYSSIHAARNGMADMAVSNSIGSNVFDILVGLSLPWFIQASIYPGVVATINSRGVIYSVILLFLSLIVTIYLMNKYEWTLKPRLGLALLIAYGLFIALSCMLEFNLFGHVNPPACPVTD